MTDPAPLLLASPEDTDHRAALFARVLRRGDCVLLSGSVGAGKSAFARAAIRELCGPHTEVPSPSFTLVQTYDSPAGEIWHCDLYRLISPDEVVELGLEEAFADAICLIEWPDRLGEIAPSDALHLTLRAAPEGHWLSVHDPRGGFAGRLEAFDV